MNRMNPNTYPGFFITFEGGEGSGKTTQIEMLVASLKSLAYDVLRTREPGGPPIAEQIRELVLDPSHTDVMAENTELLLYAAARAQHIAERIWPALAQGGVVISDRFADATTAYQGYGRGLSLNKIQQLHQIATDGLFPDLTILLDLAPEVGLQRVKQRGSKLDRLETETLAFHRRVREGYRALAAEEPARFLMLDATNAIDIIQAQIQTRTLEALKAKGLACSDRS